jgi:hypothetical protein
VFGDEVLLMNKEVVARIIFVPGRDERAVEVAVGEEEQWRPSVAFQPKKKGKKEVSGRAHGQQRHGGGWGDWVSGV